MTCIKKALALWLCCSAVWAGDVSFSGFFSAGGGKLDENNASGLAGYSEDKFTFNPDTLLALQVSGSISERASVTAQLLARGGEDFSVEAEWAYLSYALSDTLTARFGRLRTPLYLYSDYVDVGYAYHWLRTPQDVYAFPFNNFSGLDVVKQCNLGFADCTLQFYLGASSFDIGTPTGARVDAAVNDQAGLAFSLTRGWLTFRTAYHIGDVSMDFAPIFGQAFESPASCLDPSQLATNLIGTLHCFGFSDNADQIEVNGDSGYFAEVGLQIDTGRFVAVVESIELNIEDGPLPKYQRQYAMVGVRLGDVLLHVTRSESDDVAKALAEGIPSSPQTDGLIQNLGLIAAGFSTQSETNSIGLRWDFTSSTAFKLQLDDVSDDTNGDVRLTSFALQSVF